LIEWLRAELGPGHRRRTASTSALDVESLRELQRVLRDLDHEKQAAARLMPWR